MCTELHEVELKSHGLAVKDGRCWTAAGNNQRLDELAIQLGAVERSELQSERYERSRAAFRALKGLPPLVADSDDDLDDAIAEDEYRRWYEEQLFLEQLGLPHHPV